MRCDGRSSHRMHRYVDMRGSKVTARYRWALAVAVCLVAVLAVAGVLIAGSNPWHYVRLTPFGRPGVVVSPHATRSHAYEVRTGNFVLQLEESALAGHVGMSYQPAGVEQPADAAEYIEPAAFKTGDVQLGSKPLELSFASLAMPVRAKNIAANKTLVTLASACADVVATVSPERVRAQTAVVGGIVSSSKQRYAPPKIRAGAALLDVEGQHVGVTTEETGLGNEVTSTNGQRCFTRTLVTLWKPGGRLASLPNEVLTLCVAPADLREGTE